MKAGLPSRIYSRVVIFLRVFVIAGSIFAAYASWHYLPGISSLPESGIAGLLPSGSAAAAAEATAGPMFGSSLLPRIAVVQRDPGGLSVDDQRRIVRLAVRLDEGALSRLPRLVLTAHAAEPRARIRARRLAARCARSGHRLRPRFDGAVGRDRP